MKAVVQRVSSASVTCEGREVGAIGRGLAVLACVEEGDTPSQRVWTAEKLVHLRVFPDDAGKMNLSLKDVGGAMLLVSNFTVAGDCRSGRRPGFDRAMKPPRAKEEFDLLVEAVRALGVRVETGVFGGDMAVTIVNDGPVTLVVEAP
ncbi:MAG: D-aminoacyl-tRNA deacylase [Phycisphaerales bacterium]